MGMIKLPADSVNYFNENYNEIFASGELAEGKWNKRVADWVCSYTSASHAIAVSSNGAGLFALLRILKRYRNKKRIFLQSNTMYGVRTIANASGLELCGYVDCDLDYLMPTYEQVSQCIANIDNLEECVFLLTHIGGWINPDIECISQMCKERGITLIEDCAHSLGSTLNGKHSGLFGDAGVYSLYATKAIPVGEGGIVITNDAELHEMIARFIIYDRFDQTLDIGINLRMSEISALLSYSVIKETESIIENKYLVASKYETVCQNFGVEYIDPQCHGQRTNLYKFILLSRAGDPLTYFAPVKTRTSSVYDYNLGKDPKEICSRHICIPIWYMLEYNVSDTVAEEIKKIEK